ncbi:MAG: GldG family protein, partial [Oscillospiraceae bacterium]|nr:GldG family protein [Oscillospiraceae bacterium]
MAENNKNRPEDEIATEDFFEEELSAEDTAEDTAGEPAEELDPVLDQYLGDDGAMPETAAAVAAEREDEPSKNKGVSRRVRFGAVSLATTLIVVAAVVVFNILAGVLFEYYPLRLYLNKDNVYTLSEEAKEVARSVQEKVTIVAFQAETEYTAPNSGMEEIDTVIRQFYEGVNQCILASGGNISVEFFDPAANPARAAKYKEYDADRNSILFLCGDRFDLVKMNELIYFDEEWQMAYYMG